MSVPAERAHALLELPPGRKGFRTLPRGVLLLYMNPTGCGNGSTVTARGMPYVIPFARAATARRLAGEAARHGGAESGSGERRGGGGAAWRI